MSDRALYFILGVAVGMLMLYVIKTLHPAKPPCNDDGEEVRQQIMDKLNAAINDIKNTV